MYGAAFVAEDQLHLVEALATQGALCSRRMSIRSLALNSNNHSDAPQCCYAFQQLRPSALIWTGIVRRDSFSADTNGGLTSRCFGLLNDGSCFAGRMLACENTAGRLHEWRVAFQLFLWMLCLGSRHVGVSRPSISIAAKTEAGSDRLAQRCTVRLSGRDRSASESLLVERNTEH